jgi:hypothetical protein
MCDERETSEWCVQADESGVSECECAAPALRFSNPRIASVSVCACSTSSVGGISEGKGSHMGVKGRLRARWASVSSQTVKRYECARNEGRNC